MPRRDRHIWRRVHATAATPLIDGEEYFAAVRSSMIKAKSQIMIVGWELHSEVALLRGEAAERAKDRDGYPVVLADLLQRLVDETDDLRVHLLIWSGVALFALEREHLPRMKRPWDRHPRIRLAWARDTPKLASHHQKFVVVDDRVVFVGGMDLTKSRWDSHDHRVNDSRRRTPGLIPHFSDPYHETMMVCAGEVAKTLGDLARDRWHEVTGERLNPPPGAEGADPWPEGTDAAFEDREVALALTRPQYGDWTEIRQVEGAFVEHFRAAGDLLYIETQYLTASALVDVLVERLRDPDGPEIVLILPYGCPGVIQAMAIDHQRDRLIAKLRDADPGGRLGIYWPTLAAGSEARPFEESVYIHAKVLVVDDRVLRIGSANLNNRSMGLDTELDAWIEAEPGEERVEREIAAFRRRSLAYLLGCDAGEVEQAEREQGGTVAAIEHLRGGDRTLQPFEHSAPAYARAVHLDIGLADPDRPLDELDTERVLKAVAIEIGLRGRGQRIYNELVGLARRNKRVIAGALVAALTVALIWLSPAGDLIASLDPERTLKTVRDSRFGLAGVLAMMVLLGSVGFPITVLVAVAGALIGTWLAAPLILAGVTAASAAGFLLGRVVPDVMRERVLGGRAKALTNRLNENGVVAVALVRNLPIAPFAVVNAAFGVSGIGWVPYLLGTAIGMLPGVVLLSFFGRGITDLLADPTPSNILKLLALGVGVLAVAFGAQRLLRRFAPEQIEDEQSDP